jgi:hypothetical protein
MGRREQVQRIESMSRNELENAHRELRAYAKLFTESTHADYDAAVRDDANFKELERWAFDAKMSTIEEALELLTIIEEHLA